MLLSTGVFIAACSPYGLFGTSTPPVVGPTASATLPEATTSPMPSPVLTPTLSANPTPLPSPPAEAQMPLELTAIRMMTRSEGWATGEAVQEGAESGFPPAIGQLFQTSDGGSSWQVASPQNVAPRAVSAVYFLDLANAWLAASTPISTTGGGISTTITTYSTGDGGQTWRPGTPFIVGGGGPGSFSFVDPQHGWLLVSLGGAAGSEAVEILKTENGGQTWQPVSLTSGQSGQPVTGTLPFGCDKTGIAFADTSTGWAAGSCPGGSLFLYVTHDGGQTWQPQPLSPPPGYAADLFSSCQCAVNPPIFVSPRDGVFALNIYEANQGTYLYVTSDGGANWTARELPVSQLLGEPDFWSPEDGVVTDGQQLYLTGDGGQSWAQVGPLPISGTNLVGGLNFIDIDNGWLTDGHSLYVTHDGSQTWTSVAPLVEYVTTGQGASIDVTLADDGQTLSLQVGERFLLDLGKEYTWTVNIDNPTIVGPVLNAPVRPGVQGLYEAFRSGSTTLTAAGDPLCRQAQPPCATPSRQFHLQLVVQ